jgi:hypothetical protein
MGKFAKVITMLNLSMIAIVAATTYSPVASESVDMIELNHFHDCLGRHVYDQVIFWDWSEEKNTYEVRAWTLNEDKSVDDKRPQRSYTKRLYVSRWYDSGAGMSRCVYSELFRESWTQVDPERADKKNLDESDRMSLIRANVLQQPLAAPEVVQ